MNSLAASTVKAPKSRGGRPVTFDSHFVLRMEGDLAAEVRAFAKSEDRTISSVVRRAVRDYLAERRAAV
jgi:hypothetical protein